MRTSVERGTATLTRIEKVMLLQSLELFRFCGAQEMIRIASIAHSREFERGEYVYRSNDTAEALYCVVSGRVQLIDVAGDEVAVSAKESFGVLEILSGRLRAHDARADERTVTLQIEADDFFDLLSNNVEIVKALFRKVLDRSGGNGGLR